ncbi:MAG: chromosomal replication initiator protein DnaA [bacterium]|nr:chromosomal replication initiator protein DnaA [bacterium]
MASVAAIPASELWTAIMSAVAPSVSETTFSSWIETLKPEKLEDRVLTLLAPSKFHREFVEEHFVPGLEAVALENTGEPVRVRIRVQGAGEIPRQRNLRFAPPAPVNPIESNGSNGSNGHTVSVADAAAEANLNPRYRFENFIEGDCNSFARAACLAISDLSRPTLWNPLLIYGGTGLGKTHLLQSIGNRVLSVRRNDGIRVRYVSSERFTQDFIQSVRSQQGADFADKYRNVDLLLVDDIQFFATKERTQTEFFHAFNALHQSGRRIVMTSDRPVHELAGFDERLISRFDSGLVTNVNPPTYETRLAILQDRAKFENFPLPLDVADLLSTHITSNVRELEGAFAALVAHCQFGRVPATLELAQRVIQEKTGKRTGRPPVELIQQTVADYFRVSQDALRGKTRKKEIAYARMIAMYLMTEITEHSLKTIGGFFGGRDHSTVIHARDTIAGLRKTDEVQTVSALNDLERRLSLGPILRTSM